MSYNPGNPQQPSFPPPFSGGSGTSYPYNIPSGPDTATPDDNPILDALNSTRSYFQTLPPTSPEPTIAPPVAPRLPSPVVSMLCFFLAIGAFEGLGILLEKTNVSSIMVTVIGEIGIIAALPLIFCGFGRYDFNAVFSVKKVPVPTLLLCVLVGLAAQLAIIAPNALSQWFLQRFGPLYLSPGSSESALSTPDRLIFSAAALFLAPLCEETLNRGFLMAGYKKFGLIRCILVIGLLFGIFHLYPYKFVGTGLGGIILAYLVYTSGSIYCSMSAHFGFNLLPTLILWLSDSLRHVVSNGTYNVMQTSVGNAPRGDIEVMLTGSQVAATFVISGAGLGLLLLLLRIITRRSVRQRTGIVVNYLGLASEVLDNSPVHEIGPYYGPTTGYAYTPNGLTYRKPNPEFIGTRPTPQYIKSLLIAMWILLLILYAFGAYQEFRLRHIGSDCQRLGFQYCQSEYTRVSQITENQYSVGQVQWVVKLE